MRAGAKKGGEVAGVMRDSAALRCAQWRPGVDLQRASRERVFLTINYFSDLKNSNFYGTPSYELSRKLNPPNRSALGSPDMS
jgi:hypothetical protein